MRWLYVLGIFQFPVGGLMRFFIGLFFVVASFAGGTITVATAAEPIRICATVPDLGDLAQAVGGDDVAVTVFARGGDDPHFVDARPSFTKALAQADMLVVIGLELEIGWVPVLQDQARNPRILTGGAGYVDASTVIEKIGVPAAGADRGDGDVHAGGNPHYLSDPVNGLRVARVIADRVIALAPDRRERIEAHWRTFANRLGVALFGAQHGATIAADHLIDQAERETAHPTVDVGGWFAALRPAAGRLVVADHDLWPYLARRFGLTVVGFLEPKPGIAPTTRHLTELVEQMQRSQVRAILTTPYFDPRHARLVAERTGAVVIPLAHQVGSLPDATDYLSTSERNVRALVIGLAAPASK
jgi:ABC-type Zn uptake system ZnuABC Zn-binding protein ZnuA